MGADQHIICNIHSHQEAAINPPPLHLHRRLVDKCTTGGWKAASFIFVTEAAERLAFYSIAGNLITYLLFELHEPLPKAANLVTNWIGAVYLLGIPGAFIADSYLGRYLTIVIFSSCYLVGMGLMTLSATANSLRPPVCDISTTDCKPASSSQLAAVYVGLYIIAIGTGGIKPCVSAFGADQFDESNERDRKSKRSFFNWFFFSVNIGALIAFTLVFYIQDNIGWGFGFGLPSGGMAISLAVLLIGTPLYRHKAPSGSPLTRFMQVLVAAVRNRKVDVPSIQHQLDERIDASALRHTRSFSFLDKATVCAVENTSERGEDNPWKLCTVNQVEELKLFLRILPIIATTIFLWTGYSQLVTFFVMQGTSLNRRLGPHFQIPAASLPIFSVLNSLLVLPLYDQAIVALVRKLTGRDRGFTPLQRIGFGLFVSILSMMAAALVERRRLHIVKEHELQDNPAETIPMTVFWLVPQYFLVGLAEIFTYVGQLEFFYDEVSDGTRSLSTALFISELGLGSWFSSLLVTIIQNVTGKELHGWILDNINTSRIDKFYWLLAVLSTVNFLMFIVSASLYRYKQPSLSTINVDLQEEHEHRWTSG